VQLIYIAGDSLNAKLEDGSLADIAPTVLALMDINQPSVMSGKNLIKM
jgi:bisphosphoglycerate-independent phosphoglycerate mutase (AlkP superfamily)